MSDSFKLTITLEEACALKVAVEFYKDNVSPWTESMAYYQETAKYFLKNFEKKMYSEVDSKLLDDIEDKWVEESNK